MAVKGWLLQLTYRLNRHRVADVSLTLAGVIVLLLLAGAVRLGLVPWQPWVVPLSLALALVLVALGLVGRFTGYVHFQPGEMSTPIEPPEPLVPTDKIHHLASGWFGVEGKRRYLVEVEAWFRTFETREHTIVGYLPWSRFFPGRWPRNEVGLWYIFFQPEQILGIEPGQVHFGMSSRLGLQVTYRNEGRTERVVLSFDSEEGRQQVHADLMRDASF